VHRKFTQFEYQDGEATRRLEHIDTHDACVTLFWAGSWSFTVLICKDLLEVPVVRVLSDLRVRLALVPALSPKTELLEERASELATNSQAVVLVANTPSDPVAATAIFARPTRQVSRRIVVGLTDGAPPCAYVTVSGHVG
jgi:hypothetical protein